MVEAGLTQTELNCRSNDCELMKSEKLWLLIALAI